MYSSTKRRSTAMRMVNSRKPGPLILLTFIMTLILAFWKLRRDQTSTSLPPELANAMSPKPPDPLRCRKLPGAADTLVVMKTGATDFTSQVPTHFDTTFVCAPNYIIFSDHEEIFRGHQIRDVLATVSEELRAEHPDYEIYRRLSQSGRSALAPYENKQINFKAVDGDVTGGKGDSAGWKLDKWKFLPMFHQTLTLSPGYKWYMFIEPDSAIFWSTVLKYQQQLDHSRPYYMGSQVLTGDLEFAHGGSGYLVSDAALKRVVEYYVAHKQDLEKFNEAQWAGDAVAGETFKRADASLTRVWPIVQGDHPGEFPWGRDHGDKPLWCFPTMTWHHMSAADVEDMWDFEQRWIAAGGLDNTTSGGYLRYRDVFTSYIQPQMKTAKSSWDNGSSLRKGLGMFTVPVQFANQEVHDVEGAEAGQEGVADGGVCQWVVVRQGGRVEEEEAGV